MIPPVRTKGRSMKLRYLAAAFAVAAFPLCAQAQQSGAPKPTNADAQKVVQAITADKAKLKIYCEMAALSEQIDAAEQKKDTKTADALAQKIDSMAEQLGPSYILLMDGLQDMDENSKEAEAIGKTLEGLDEMCGK
jgi:uncharacterized coiled-coil DUF342 family protein